MEDFFKSIKAYLYDRSVSPLMGSFAISWLLWNYKVVMIVLSSEKIENKFLMIDSIYQESNLCILKMSVSGVFLDGLLAPILMSIFYIFCYPYIAIPVYEFSLKKRKRLRDVKNKVEDLQLLTLEESRRLYREMATLENKHETEISSYRGRVDALNREIKKLTSSHKENRETNSSETTNVKNFERLDVTAEKILSLFSGLKDGHGWTAASIEENIDIHIDKIRFNLDSLVERDFIFKNGTIDDDEIFYQLGPDGRQYLIEHDLLLDYEKLSDEVKEKLDDSSESLPE